MDSLPQELLEEIIDHLPKRDTSASSLISRRWRRRSQQRYCETICFFSAHRVVLWEANIPNGILSYIRHVRFIGAPRISLEPTTLGRILKPLGPRLTLTMHNVRILLPGELTDPVSLGEFGKGVTRLVLSRALYTPLTALVSFIFSFPNLKELVVNDILLTSYELPPILPDAQKRGPLELLVLWKIPRSLGTDLIRRQLTSQTLCLNPRCGDMGELVFISAESVATLILFGMRSLWISRE